MTIVDRLNAFQITRADLNSILDMIAPRCPTPSSDLEEMVMQLYRPDPDRGQAVYHRLWALAHAASCNRALAWMRLNEASRRMRDIMLDVATTMRLVDTGDGLRFPEDDFLAEVTKRASRRGRRSVGEF